MDMQKLAFPAVAFAVGAILGRVFGLKTLMRGAMTAAAVTGIGSAQPALLAVGRSAAPRARKTVHRAARKKTAQRKSPRIAATRD